MSRVFRGKRGSLAMRLLSADEPTAEEALVERYARDPSSLSTAERKRVNELARADPTLRAALRPGGRWWSGVGFVLGCLLSAMLNWFLAGYAIPEGLSALDRLAAVESRRGEWGVYLGVALAAVGACLVLVRRSRRVRVAVPLGLLLFALLAVAGTRWTAAGIRAERADLDRLFVRHQWIAYESPRFDPRRGTVPTAAEIEEELIVLNAVGGFDALITFGSDGVLAEVPRLAKEKCGFKAVIQGIAIPEWKDAEGRQADPDAAFAAQLDALLRPGADGRPANDFVDAYSVGHNVSNRIPLDRLAGWMAEARRRTDRPTSTTGPMIHYLGANGRRFREIGDFYFPDANGGWSTGATPETCLANLQRDLYRVGELTDKPVLMKMVSFPSGGRGLTPEAQYQFFLNMSRSVVPPRSIYMSIFSAFDLSWKAPPDFDDTEAHVGLFAVDLTAPPGRRFTPKKALAVLKGGFLVQNRP